MARYGLRRRLGAVLALAGTAFFIPPAAGQSAGPLSLKAISGPHVAEVDGRPVAGKVTAMTFSERDDLLYAAVNGGFVRWKGMRNPQEQPEAVDWGGALGADAQEAAALVSPAPDVVLLAGRQNEVTYYRPGELPAPFLKKEGWMLAVAWTPKKPSRIVAGGQDKKLYFFDVQAEQLARPRLLGQVLLTETILAIAFSPSGSLVAAACIDGRVHVFDTDRRVRVGQRFFTTPGTPVLSAAFLDEDLIACGGLDGRLYVGNVNNPVVDAKARVLFQHAKRIDALAADSKREILASGSQDGTVRVWQMEFTGRLKTRAVKLARAGSETVSSAGVRSLAILNQGRLLLTGDYEGAIRRYEIGD